MGGGRGWVVVCGVGGGEERAEEKVENEYIISKIINLCNFKLFLIKRSDGRVFWEKGGGES
jgi:hypothetical protein